MSLKPHDVEMLKASCRIALRALWRGVEEFAGRVPHDAGLGAVDSIKPSLLESHEAEDKQNVLLQEVIETAEKLALGIDHRDDAPLAMPGRTNPDGRLQTLFEGIDNTEQSKHAARHRYPLKPLSPEALFPVTEEGMGDQGRQYVRLWRAFSQALNDLNNLQRVNWALWLDCFDTLWEVYGQAIPAMNFESGADLSLYDHSRVSAALATALWRSHQEAGDNDPNFYQNREQKHFLVIQGQLFGAEELLFASGEKCREYAAKLLHGRSCYLALLKECAILKILETLILPSTSQVIDGNGKFMIIAPNNARTRAALQRVRQELDDWFLSHCYAQAGIDLAWVEAGCEDFAKQSKRPGVLESPYRHLLTRLSAQMDLNQYRRFQLCERPAASGVLTIFLDDFNDAKGVCQFDGRSPASVRLTQDVFIGAIASDQLKIGDSISRCDRIWLSRAPLPQDAELKIPLFGYHVGFSIAEDLPTQANGADMLRVWDFSLPEAADRVMWDGCARRNLNAYVPMTSEQDRLQQKSAKYAGIGSQASAEPKTLSNLACNDRTQMLNGSWQGICALSTLKGEVDDLEWILLDGLGNEACLGKTAAMTRQIAAFFNYYLPWLCHSQYPNAFTLCTERGLLATGPWLSQIQLAADIRQAFQGYVGGNDALDLSMGIRTTKPDLAVGLLAEGAEQALMQARVYQSTAVVKHVVSCFGRCLSWSQLSDLIGPRRRQLQRLCDENGLGIDYIYMLLGLVEMAENVSEKPENALWHSYFAYRTARMLDWRSLDKAQLNARQAELADEIAEAGIHGHGGNYRVALYCYLYSRRK